MLQSRPIHFENIIRIINLLKQFPLTVEFNSYTQFIIHTTLAWKFEYNLKLDVISLPTLDIRRILKFTYFDFDGFG